MRGLTKILMTGVAVAVMALAFAVSGLPAHAQSMPGGPQAMPGPDGSGKHNKKSGQAAQQDQKPKVDDKDYHSALDRLPDQKYDPWRGTR
jgi:Spy/CpxP family protein refolding chaperone